MLQRERGSDEEIKENISNGAQQIKWVHGTFRGSWSDTTQKQAIWPQLVYADQVLI